MTWTGLHWAEPEREVDTLCLAAEERPDVRSISVVVPVRDNAEGIARLQRWWRSLTHRPLELIVVDDGSSIPVTVNADDAYVVRKDWAGPASARNAGWRVARGRWIAFIDSDCMPCDGWTGAWSFGWSGEIALQGAVRARGADPVSAFYDGQQTLAPMQWTADGRPLYLVTANAMVHRSALELVGGFDERFRLAGGEDVDLGLRLRRIGAFRYAPAAKVLHDFEPSVRKLLSRFFRYGRGNRQLARRHARERRVFAPRPFLPRRLSVWNVALSGCAFAALAAGWHAESLRGDPRV